MSTLTEETHKCAGCDQLRAEINRRPVIRCSKCGVVWISELCALIDGNKEGWRQAMQREFGKHFRYVVTP